MQNNKNNITLSFKNIISFLRILTGYFTDIRKIITLSLIILILSFVNITLCFSDNFVSALSYESEVGIGFTFNPTLSVSLSSLDLVIPNLTPGSSSDSNSINVSVATNASYGYTLSANVGSNDSISPYYHSSDLILNTNNSNVFSSIATNADLFSLDNSENNNIWGYSTSLDNGSSWSNYNGLSSSTNTTLIDNSNAADSTGNIDFKIGAKASSTQASGTYTNTITFTAVTKPIPITLAESYASEGKTMVNGFYTMQDMTSTICSRTEAIGSQLQVLDIRDYKVYWIAKLADNHCWMTQNLDLDITAGTTDITSDNTDLSTDTSVYTENSQQGAYTLKGTNDYGYAVSTENNNAIITWIPERSTITYNSLSNKTWINDANHPYSYDKLNNDGTPYYPDSTVTQAIAGNHALSGNYYNWTAAIASNDSSSLNKDTESNIANNPKNSICPKGWRLPTVSTMKNGAINSTNEFGRINLLYNNGSTSDPSGLMNSPLRFIRSGRIASGILENYSNNGYYWSSTVYYSSLARTLYFGSNSVDPAYYSGNRYLGFSIRCLARQ